MKKNLSPAIAQSGGCKARIEILARMADKVDIRPWSHYGSDFKLYEDLRDLGVKVILGDYLEKTDAEPDGDAFDEVVRDLDCTDHTESACAIVQFAKHDLQDLVDHFVEKTIPKLDGDDAKKYICGKCADRYNPTYASLLPDSEFDEYISRSRNVDFLKANFSRVRMSRLTFGTSTNVQYSAQPSATRRPGLDWTNVPNYVVDEIYNRGDIDYLIELMSVRDDWPEALGIDFDRVAKILVDSHH